LPSDGKFDTKTCLQASLTHVFASNFSPSWLITFHYNRFSDFFQVNKQVNKFQAAMKQWFLSVSQQPMLIITG